MKSEQMQKWEYPRDYIGATWYEYYMCLGQHRDSDTITRSNFICALAALGGESDTVIIERSSHWAVGWIETLLIHESAADKIAIADKILSALENYPVLNEEHYCKLESTEAAEIWERLPISDRVDECQRWGVSIFAARRDELPETPTGELIVSPDYH